MYTWAGLRPYGLLCAGERPPAAPQLHEQLSRRGGGGVAPAGRKGCLRSVHTLAHRPDPRSSHQRTRRALSTGGALGGNKHPN
jgi:hypothetical protein